MISLITDEDARPGAAVQTFLEQYGIVWNADQLREGSLLEDRDLYHCVDNLVDAWLTATDQPIVLTWKPTEEETPHNYPVLSDDSLIGKLFVAIRGDSRALMLMIDELELSPPEGATYTLAIYQDSLELNGRVIWIYKPGPKVEFE